MYIMWRMKKKINRCTLEKEGFCISVKIKKLLCLLFLLCFFSSMPVQMSQAAGTNVVASAQKISSGKWVKDSRGWKYQYKNGTYAKNAWLNISGSLYRIDADGYREKGTFQWDGAWYYANPKTGKLYVSQWRCVNDTTKYFYQADGTRAQYKWVTRGTSTYFFQRNGKLAMNQIIEYQNNYYYVNRSGVRMKNTWLVKSGKRYYLTGSGAFLRNSWLKSKGKFYFLDKEGVMAANCWVGNYYVGANGWRLTNCMQDGWYLDETGKSAGRFLFVGDSRMVGMEAAMNASEQTTDTKYIARVGMGYYWLNSTAGTELKKQLQARPNLKVVFALGVNDLGNINSYVAYYKQLMREFPDTKFYFFSVNPVNEAKEAQYGYRVKNTQIEAFNQVLSREMGSRYVDSYTYLKTNGFSTVDGLHYTTATYRKLRSYIVTHLV